MRLLRNRFLWCFGIVGILAAGLTPPLPGEESTSRVLRVGVIDSVFFNPAPEVLPRLLQPFQSLIEQHTGLEGRLTLGGDADNLGKALAEGKLHLGVFHGFELAWARQKYPGLKPLVLALTQHPKLHAYLVVRSDCKADCLVDLKGQVLAVPHGNLPHTTLFLQRACRAERSTPEQFFSRLTKPTCSQMALDQVVDGQAAAALVDQPALDSYREWRAPRFDKLRIAVRSEAFPATAIVYCSDCLSESLARRCREGFLRANDTQQGQETLSMCGVRAMKAVPRDYEEELTAIAKAYPPPPASAR
jgi:ABC-type phosphate/phosphonate transport system substrate-binding protein